jgi:hypothetical protein
LRPQAETKSVGLEALEAEIERFEPQVVICSGHKAVDSDERLAWIELSLDPTSPTKISVGDDGGSSPARNDSRQGYPEPSLVLMRCRFDLYLDFSDSLSTHSGE